MNLQQEQRNVYTKLKSVLVSINYTVNGSQILFPIKTNDENLITTLGTFRGCQTPGVKSSIITPGSPVTTGVPSVLKEQT